LAPRPAEVPVAPAPAVCGVSGYPGNPPALDTSERRASDSPSSTLQSPAPETTRGQRSHETQKKYNILTHTHTSCSCSLVKSKFGKYYNLKQLFYFNMF